MATKVLTPSSSQIFQQPRARRASPPSSTTLYISTSPPYSSSPKQSSYRHPAEHHERIDSPSPPSSSAGSSPPYSMINFSNTSSLNSTPLSSGLSFRGSLSTPDEDIDFPNYDDHFSSHSTDDTVSRRSTDEDAEAPEISASTDTTRSDSPLHTPSVSDDTAIKQEPSQHVDYLSHDWREEDIWASWRHIVSQRKVYGQRSRLENASWRTWAKSKYRLRTISPETLNWLKESDVTWLYGPLKPAQSHPVTSNPSTPGSRLSKSSSFVHKKPILKKRSVSEVMLQKSLSTSSLLKQAAASVQAQQTKSPRSGLNRINSELAYPITAPSQPPSREDSDYFSNRTSSGYDETPSDTKEKHIRFDEVVEQCVAIDCKDPMFGDDDEVEDDPPNSSLSESSSDEGLLMTTKKSRPGPSKGSQKGRLSRSNSSSGKMIETIEATTLKYRTDSPDTTQQQQQQPAQHHTFGRDWTPGMLSPSPSQETLRPSRPSRNFLLAEDEEEDDADSATWSFGASNPRSSLGASVNASPSNSRGDFFHPTEGYEGMQGMRRTESGMFMPIDEDEDDLVAAGLFGRVSETVNTVKDIGWVLWNSFSARRDS